MKQGVAAAVLGMGLLLWAGAAAGQDVQFSVRSQVGKGERPAILVTPGEELRSVAVELVRKDGKKLSLSRKNLKADQEVALEFKQAEPLQHYTATLRFVTDGGAEGTSEFEFDVSIASGVQLVLSLERSRSSLERRTLVLTANAPVKQAEFEVLGSGDVVLDQGVIALGGVKPGGDITVTWTSPAEQPVEKVNVKVYDPQGSWTSVQVIPFTVDIPHDEVEFESGKASFASSEERKLESTWGLLTAEIERHGKDLELQLYIAGYTDTVGDAGGNLGLSEARARSIAAWFRKRGLKIPVYYQGFGESVLAVGTGDNVDEPRNRRALYILGNQAPPLSGQLPKAAWKKL